MLTGHNLIYFAPETWDGLWRNRQQLMTVFAQHNQVLYVEEIPRFDRVKKRLKQGTLTSKDLFRASLQHRQNSLYTFRYPVWGAQNNKPGLGSLTRLIRCKALNNAIKRLDIQQPIIWFHRPEMITLLDEIPPYSLLIYHVVDEYTAYGGHTSASRQRTQAREQRLLAAADAVVVVSEKLYESKQPFNANTYLVQNGVDYPAYERALAAPALPVAFEHIKAPRLGYIGNISNKLNLVLLIEIAQKRPDWSIVFLGATNLAGEGLAHWEMLLALPNVYYLGSVTASEVPNYLMGFNVGLMPYVQNQHSENISPLKLYDYLAAGLAVASIDIPAVRKFCQHVHIAPTPTHFCQAIESALSDSSPTRTSERRNVAKAHTWEARVEQLSELIQQLLNEKQYREKLGKIL